MNDKLISQEDFWKDNFNNNEIVKKSDDLQINIARTKNGEVIKKEIWGKTVNYIVDILEISKASKVLELCCGNGVLIGEISKICETAVGIDFSNELLEQLKYTYKNNNLKVYNEDVNVIELDSNNFDIILLYFSIQHFNERNTYKLIEKCIKYLKPRGKFLIGDIPDMDKKWNYINKPEYHIDYFRRVILNKPKIGYWYQKDFFKAMASCFPDIELLIIDQPKYQINSDHCFDVLIVKK